MWCSLSPKNTSLIRTELFSRRGVPIRGKSLCWCVQLWSPINTHQNGQWYVCNAFVSLEISNTEFNAFKTTLMELYSTCLDMHTLKHTYYKEQLRLKLIILNGGKWLYMYILLISCFQFYIGNFYTGPVKLFCSNLNFICILSWSL